MHWLHRLRGEQPDGPQALDTHRRRRRAAQLRARRRARASEPAGADAAASRPPRPSSACVCSTAVRRTSCPRPAGEFVVARARRLVFDGRCLERDVDLYRDRSLGDTAFGVGPFPAATFLPPLLASLRRDHPAIALRVEIGNWELLLQRLLRRRHRVLRRRHARPAGRSRPSMRAAARRARRLLRACRPPAGAPPQRASGAALGVRRRLGAPAAGGASGAGPPPRPRPPPAT